MRHDLSEGWWREEEVEEEEEEEEEGEQLYYPRANQMCERPIGWRNERNAWAALSAILATQLDAYNDDGDRIGGDSGTDLGLGPSVDPRASAAGRVAAGEKRVLKHWALLARLLEEHLDFVHGNFDAGIELAGLIEVLVQDNQFLGDDDAEDGSNGNGNGA